MRLFAREDLPDIDATLEAYDDWSPLTVGLLLMTGPFV